MKKRYIIPDTSIMQAQVEEIIATSGSGVTGGIGNNVEIGYGGIDDDGGLNPSVKESNGDINWDF